MGCAIGLEVFCVRRAGGRVYYWDGVGVVVAEVDDGLDLDERVEPAVTDPEGDEVDFRAGYSASGNCGVLPNEVICKCREEIYRKIFSKSIPSHVRSQSS